jgi:ABC-type branched-subunit amino acid transport system ATPase component/predicted MFS family arabinose efflux permease
MTAPAEPEGAPASLVAGVLDEEQRRQTDHDVVVDPGDAALGVDAAPVTLRAAFHEGGTSLLVVVGLLGLVQMLDVSAFAVLAPDIQKTLDVSDGVIGALGGAFGAVFVLGAIPFGASADRYPRPRIAGIGMVMWTSVVAATAVVTNAFSLFLARLGTGFGRSFYLPVTSSSLTDEYPIGARARVFAASGSFQLAGLALGPLFAAVVAEAAGGSAGWRWVFAATAVLGVPAFVAAFRMREPRRGRYEMQEVLGDQLGAAADGPAIPTRIAFERLRKIRTLALSLVGLGVVGFAVFSMNIFVNLYLEDEFGLTPFERGAFASLVILPGIVGALVVGQHADARLRTNPARVLSLTGALVAAFGVLEVVGLWMPTVWSFGILAALAAICSWAVFTIAPGVFSTLIPYRLRSRGYALLGIDMFLVGAFGGAVLTGVLSNGSSERTALTIVLIPAALIGGALMVRAGRVWNSDASLVVDELREEVELQQRVADESVPVLQVRNLDFSYGKVQVLFDVSLEVQRGESIALLGANGAGKSTLLRVVSGLEVPERGVVRLNGHTITYSDAEDRARMGVVLLAGGRAVFPSLSIDENLRMAGFQYSRAECETRAARVFEIFPILADRKATRARDLSGGQRQMLALAMALMHDPEILIIDELSLGLAPVAVQALLQVVDRLRAEGLTMIIVEQSLNIAAAVADRAVFVEKGQVRFVGSARELAERDDLARAVFLGQGTP